MPLEPFLSVRFVPSCGLIQALGMCLVHN
uniref:Uncharacterized protein n=1 Tax=Arundo donax TaxID=35708 RepID=A0A0A9FUK0_ARUDO